jgi:hypothetical protein
MRKQGSRHLLLALLGALAVIGVEEFLAQPDRGVTSLILF